MQFKEKFSKFIKMTTLVLVSTFLARCSSSSSGNPAATSATQRLPISQQLGTKLKGNDNVGTAQQGSAVALSADGNTAVVGGSFDDTTKGAVWVYTKTNSVWSQQGTKIVVATASTRQGYSVAVNADGTTIIIGAIAGIPIGGAYVFNKVNGVWTQEGGLLQGTGSAGGVIQQGISVATSSDGNTAIICSLSDDSSNGAAWVFTRSGGVWTQQGAKLVASGNVGAARFCSSVSLSADGNTALFGGRSDDTNVGAAWVFTRSGGVWTQQGTKLVGSDYSGAATQGFAVALSADGNTALVGGPGDTNGGALAVGASWVFTRSGGVWTQKGAKLVGTGAVGASSQGRSVSISSDGLVAVVGAPADEDGAGGTSGALWVFNYVNGAWTQQGNKLVGTGNTGSAGLGISVSLDYYGTSVVTGGSRDDSNIGATWVFTN